MNIAVIAANGRSGNAFVEYALKRGHHVRAGVHGNHNFISSPQLDVFSCDATNIDDIVNLTNNQDAVVSFIGHTRKSDPDVQTKAMKALVAASETTGVTRVVSLTGTGVRQPGDIIPFTDRILTVAISIIDPERVKDGKEHAAVLQGSNLAWTIIRVLKLQNTKPAPFELTSHGPTKLYVSREEVATAVLEVLENNTFIKDMPIISKVSKGA